MKGLKLGQRIYVDSSCYFESELLKIEKTSIADARTIDGGEVIVTMAKDHNWGALPDRRMDSVVTNTEDAQKIVEKRVLPLIERKGITLGTGRGKTILFVEERGSSLVIKHFKFENKVDSLKDGSFEVYRTYEFGGSSSIKIFDGKLPAGWFDNLEDAVKQLQKLVKNNLGS